MRRSWFARPREEGGDPSSNEGALFDDAIHSDKEVVKGGKKRHQQHLQGATTMTNHDFDNAWEAGGSGMRRIPTSARNDKRQARWPTDHFKSLLEEACPNHAYPVRHDSRTVT
jgi:hypothetical protein